MAANSGNALNQATCCDALFASIQKARAAVHPYTRHDEHDAADRYTDQNSGQEVVHEGLLFGLDSGVP